MGFPNAKVHRRSRRKLGRGQIKPLPQVTVTPTDSGSTVILTFNLPVVINGSLDIKPSGLTFVGQVQTSQTVWTLTYSGATTGKTYTGIPAGSPVIQSMQGGQFAGLPAGTLP
jgi:hypothetical protein